MNDITKLIEPRILKGFRDFTAEEVIKRNYLKSKIVEVFELYGFEPLETPAIEYLETFTGNIGADENLFFKFEDQGGRSVALRYDQTVPTCRYVAQNINNLQLPYKRYQIQSVWRAEKPQKGRYREFVQCDADIFGVNGWEADAEVIALTLDIYKNLGFKNYIVKINDRALFKDVPYAVIVAVDKLDKVGEEGVIKEMVGKGYSSEEATSMLKSILTVKPNETVTKILSYLKDLGLNENQFVFDPTIARSFSYSSGPIWEVVIPGFTSGSVLGGERFDNLIGRFINKSIPGTGFGLGFDRTLEAMEEFKLFPDQKTKTKALVTVFGRDFLGQSLALVKKLRGAGINTELYSDSEAKLGKQVKYADKKSIPYIVVLGEEEAQKGEYMLKNMQTGQQQSLSLESLISSLKNN
jgi:histidyl-tRNA synthetase